MKVFRILFLRGLTGGDKIAKFVSFCFQLYSAKGIKPHGRAKRGAVDFQMKIDIINLK